MEKAFLLLVIAIGAFGISQGLRCWRCSATSRRECMKRGRWETCQRGQRMSCATHIRYGEGPRRQTIISKGCKQRNACENEARQNEYQCMPEGRSNCRCCCQQSRCNIINFWCAQDSRCKILAEPLHGTKQCLYDVTEEEIGSKCTFSCHTGFHLMGSEVSICERVGEEASFSSPPPACVRLSIATSSTSESPTQSIPPSGTTTTTPERCDDPPLSPADGVTKCQGNGETGTVCYFVCRTGYRLIGATDTRCIIRDGFATWDQDTPTCEDRRNTLRLSDDDAGETGVNVRDEELDGNSVCENPPESSNSERICGTSGEGMTCAYYCLGGRSLVGEAVLTCTQMTGWSGMAPKCVASCSPLPNNPSNGVTRCDGSGEINTICEFHCDIGFELLGSERIACILQGGSARWSDGVPFCEENESFPGLLKMADDWYESAGLVVAALTSEDEVELAPLTESEDLGETQQCWECVNAKSKEECTLKGKSITCQAEMWCKTEIRYNAASGGMPMITKGCKRIKACQDEVPQNSNDCSPSLPHSLCRCCCSGNNCNTEDFWCRGTGGSTGCDVLTVPTDGTKDCKFNSSEGEVGTICKFTCDDGFTLQGEPESVCKEVLGGKPAFSSDTPTCFRVSTIDSESPTTTAMPSPTTSTVPMTPARFVEDCQDYPAPPENGGSSCIPLEETMTCTYYCGDDEFMVGPATIHCSPETGWNATTPQCLPMCTELPAIPVNGDMSCEGFGKIGTECNFVCNLGYQLDGTSSTLCNLQGENAMWSSQPPKCISVARNDESIPLTPSGLIEEPADVIPTVPTDETPTEMPPNRIEAIGADGPLKCWSCVDAHSDSECFMKGHLKTCGTEQASCLTEIRYKAGPRNSPIIFMGCKEAHACANDQMQNENDCVAGAQHPVCRCCCQENDCNYQNFWCAVPGDAPFCDTLPDLTNGVKNCLFDLFEGEIGARCSFSCNRGYTLEGAPESVCNEVPGQTKPIFSNNTPICNLERQFEKIIERNATLECWECKNVNSQRQCRAEGKAVTCDRGMACKTEIRFGAGDGGSMMVTMGCKQSQACENEVNRNELECSTGTLNAVCRCCCYETRCNYQNFWCAYPQEFTFDEDPATALTEDDGKSPQCWECLNARSESECRSQGRPITCDNEMTCRTEIRYGVGASAEPVISMGCKDTVACQNEMKQNENDCKPDDPKAICRCCCDENNCNLLDFWCAGPGEMPAPQVEPTQPVELQCWECSSMDSETLCRENGTMVSCHLGDVCKTEIRYGAGRGGAPMITMGCKQKNACEIEKAQNVNDCATSRSHPVCRCCCSEKGCNLDNFWCAGPGYPGCDRLPDLANGVKNCVYDAFEGEVGSVCTFTCNAGFTLEGEPKSECVEREGEKAIFSNDAPVCVLSEKTPPVTTKTSSTPPADDLRCPPLPPVDKGNEICNFTSTATELGSSCVFSCLEGYELIGDPEIICQMTESGPSWSSPSPVCELAFPEIIVTSVPTEEPAMCTPLPEAPANSVGGCNGTGEIGTMCGYICNFGHVMLGCQTSQCIMLNGEAIWTANPPTCVAVPKSDIRVSTTTTTRPPPTTTTTAPPPTTTTTTPPTTTTTPPTTTTTTLPPTTTTTTPPTTTTTTTTPPTTTTTTPPPTTTTTAPLATTTTIPPATTPVPTTTDSPTTTTTTPPPTTTTAPPTTIMLTEELPTEPLPTLKCWECDNAKSQSECLRGGRTATCEGDARCWSQIQYLNGELTVSKGCRTAAECLDLIEATASQCNEGTDDSLCDCCCDGYRCNRRNFWCANESLSCEILEPPPFGFMDCDFQSFEGEIGTRCRFSCREGYTLVGEEHTACVQWKRGKQPQFANHPPVCEKSESGRLVGSLDLTEDFRASSRIERLGDCNVAPPPPPGGERECLVFSGRRICTYTCADDEIMIGTGVLACSIISGWDGTTPQCTPFTLNI